MWASQDMRQVEAIFLGGARVDVEKHIPEVAHANLSGLLDGAENALSCAGSSRAVARGHYTTARFHTQ